MRINGVRTIIQEKVDWTQEGSCNQEEYCLSCYPRSVTSCSDYIQNLQENYNYTNIKKTCCRLSFFKSSFNKMEDLHEFKNNDFLGYCVIHTDEFSDHNYEPCEPNCYITEAVLKGPFNRTQTNLKEKRYSKIEKVSSVRHIISGKHKVTVDINGVTFLIESNYFSQQNAITNTCANAAIKMNYRAYIPTLTAEDINSTAKVKHSKQKGNIGLNAKQICAAIEKTANRKTYWIRTTYWGTDNFFKIIYHAIESRLPVILSFSIPSSSQKQQYSDETSDNGNSAHALAITGHTFNKNNWWSYGLKFYTFPNLLTPFTFGTPRRRHSYISSFTWCDNLIVQDDNMGPYYFFPIPSLSGMKRYNLFKLIKNGVLSIIPLHVNKKARNATISFPPEMDFFPSTVFKVEPNATTIFEKYIEQMIHADLFPLQNERFQKYFFEFYNDKSLILRSFIVNKATYITSIEGKIDSLTLRLIEKTLPDYFWISEISVPELFWVNKQKIGEIISIPKHLWMTYKCDVKLITLPGVVSLLDNEEWINYTQKNDSLRALISLSSPARVINTSC